MKRKKPTQTVRFRFKKWTVGPFATWAECEVISGDSRISGTAVVWHQGEQEMARIENGLGKWKA